MCVTYRADSLHLAATDYYQHLVLISISHVCQFKKNAC
jgi:hypothetical protein